MANYDDNNKIANSINREDEKWVMDSIEEAIPPPSSSARIPRVPKILVSDRENSDIYYEKYYVPRVVSIGPYHYNNQKLELLEKLKPVFTKKLLSNYNVSLNTLYKKLGGANMVQELRKFYEEKSTHQFSDKVFSRMMLLDGCFILYYILFIYGVKAESCGELRSDQIVFIQQDLFLLENQIPYIVVNEVMNLIKLDHRSLYKIQSFLADNNSLSGNMERGCLRYDQSQKIQSFLADNNLLSGNLERGCLGQDQSQKSLKMLADHLLHHIHSIVTRVSSSDTEERRIISNRISNVTELVDVGINFKPSSVMSLAHVELVEKKCWMLSADLKLPSINVDDSTKSMLLNLIAYEMCSGDSHAWVTSYICLLNSLIDHPEDVKVLRKARVLDNTLGSDAEVVKVFKEICTGLVPNRFAYSQAKNKIVRHYESLRNTWFARLKHEFVKNPWSFLALLGVVDLFLSAVQTVYAVWSPNGKGK